MAKGIISVYSIYSGPTIISVSLLGGPSIYDVATRPFGCSVQCIRLSQDIARGVTATKLSILLFNRYSHQKKRSEL